VAGEIRVARKHELWHRGGVAATEAREAKEVEDVKEVKDSDVAARTGDEGER